MIRKVKYLLLTIFAFILFYLAYLTWLKSPDWDYVKNGIWSHRDGYKLNNGDFVDFLESNVYTLSSDTILVNNIPKAVVTKISKWHQEITIRSLTSYEIGIYYNNESLKRL